MECKNCGEEIADRHVNVGGPIGSMQDGYLHVETAQQQCEGKTTVATPAG